MGLLLFLRRGVPARSAPGWRALLLPLVSVGAAVMHDAFEHVPILEKLPLQIDCLAAWGEPLGPRPCLPRHAGQPPFLFRPRQQPSGPLGAGCPAVGCLRCRPGSRPLQR